MATHAKTPGGKTRSKQPVWISNPAQASRTLWDTGRVVRPYIVVKVSQAAVALGGPIELSHLGDAEAGHELSPDGGTQPVAQRHAHPVLPLHRLVRLVQQVAADLPNVLHNLGGTERKDSLGPLHQAPGCSGFLQGRQEQHNMPKVP